MVSKRVLPESLTGPFQSCLACGPGSDLQEAHAWSSRSYLKCSRDTLVSVQGRGSEQEGGADSEISH